MATAQVDTPFGTVGIAASARGVVEVSLTGPVLDVAAEPSLADADSDALASDIANRAAQQFAEYFAGQRREFDLPLDCPLLDGPDQASSEQGGAEQGGRDERPFRARALSALLDVPYGESVTYGELAAMAGSPRAARAAGTACSTNPLAIIIPCHRVLPVGGGVGSFGASLGSYAGGVEMKRWLLELEGWTAPQAGQKSQHQAGESTRPQPGPHTEAQP
nr:methylated-DNA--[protein]-cysteine S-methyltransferase [Corynebacterium lactis]